MEKYKVRVTKDYLTFCSGHFIIYDRNQCERLHGHNYRVAAEIEGPLNEDYLVVDFIALKRILRALTDEIDHRMLIPLRCRMLQVEVGDSAVRLSTRDEAQGKEWIFPRGDCALLPVENTTVELLAHWLAGRLAEELRRHAEARGVAFRPSLLRVEVEESPGQSASYEVAEGGDAPAR